MTADPQSRRTHWDAVYRGKPHDAVSWYQAEPAPSLAALDRLGLAPEAPLVDVGGGASTLACALLDRGWTDLTVVDVSAAALEVARGRLGPAADCVDWIAADVTAWRPERRFAVWHDRAVFHFLTGAADCAAYREALLAGTAPGAFAIFATFAPDGPATCSGLPVRRYDAAALASEVGPSFEPVRDWREVHVTPAGREQAFQWCVVRRR